MSLNLHEEGLRIDGISHDFRRLDDSFGCKEQPDDSCKEFLAVSAQTQAQQSPWEFAQFDLSIPQEVFLNLWSEPNQESPSNQTDSTCLEGTRINSLISESDQVSAPNIFDETDQISLESLSTRSMIVSDFEGESHTRVWDIRRSHGFRTDLRREAAQDTGIIDPLTRIYTLNQLHSAAQVLSPLWDSLTRVLLCDAKPTSDGLFVVDTSRRDDQLIKKVMTCCKDLLYKPIKDTKILVGSVWRKLSKWEAFKVIKRDYCNNDDKVLSAWFGSDLKHGFKNTNVDWLLSSDGEPLLTTITNQDQVLDVLRSMEEQTLTDIQTNVLSKLHHHTQADAFLGGRDQSTKLPCSVLCNKAAALYFYQRIFNRGLDYMITDPQSVAAVSLRRAIALVRSQIANTNAGRRFLEELGEPDARGYLQLPKKVPIYFEVVPIADA